MQSALRELVQVQSGVVSRRQLLAHGLTADAIQAQLTARRWQRLHRGVFAVFTGPLPAASRLWAGLLACGDGAVVAGRSALQLAGLQPAGLRDGRSRGRIEVEIPTRRRVSAPDGVLLSRRDPAVLSRAVGSPPRLPVELAVCDVTDRLHSTTPMVDLVLAVVQQRLTTPQRLADELAARPRHSRRGDLVMLLQETVDGVRSPLERRFARNVVGAHGLPVPQYNHRDVDDEGTVRYRDARFLGGRVLVELDGRLAHPDAEAFRDRRRDNRAALAGSLTLRYGLREVFGDSCGVAGELAEALHRDGWTGRAQCCGPGCTVRPAA